MADIGSNCQLIAYLPLCDWNAHTSFMIIAEIGEMLYIFLSISWHRVFWCHFPRPPSGTEVYCMELFPARIQTFDCISFNYIHNAWEIYFIHQYSWCLLHISFLAFHWTNDAIKARINICYIEMFAIVAIFHHYSSLQNATCRRFWEYLFFSVWILKATANAQPPWKINFISLFCIYIFIWNLIK